MEMINSFFISLRTNAGSDPYSNRFSLNHGANAEKDNHPQ